MDNKQFLDSPHRGVLDRLRDCATAFHEDETGATATEYIILLILVACFVIAIVKIYGETASLKMEEADNSVSSEVSF